MKGRRLSDSESMKMLLDEIDRALILPSNFEEIIKPFTKEKDNVDIQNNKYSK